jgi:mRNA-degrading endonuclease RelE of RelBE toxin-antitoxin system
VENKLNAIALTPTDPRLSKPLTEVSKRTARIGDYRIVFEIEENLLLVSDIGPRGQVYKKLR